MEVENFPIAANRFLGGIAIYLDKDRAVLVRNMRSLNLNNLILIGTVDEILDNRATEILCQESAR